VLPGQMDQFAALLRRQIRRMEENRAFAHVSLRFAACTLECPARVKFV
jgi:hypothetical protein